MLGNWTAISEEQKKIVLQKLLNNKIEMPLYKLSTPSLKTIINMMADTASSDLMPLIQQMPYFSTLRNQESGIRNQESGIRNQESAAVNTISQNSSSKTVNETSDIPNNEQIESISKLENGHFLIVVKEKARTQLSLFLFDDNIKCTHGFYKVKGELELHDLASVKIFLSVNKRHLTVELSNSILQKAEELSQDTNTSSSELISSKLTLFFQTGEKIPLKRLHKIKNWSQIFNNPRKLDTNLLDIFSDIFRIIFPLEKREKIPGSPFFQVFENEGNIQIPTAKDQIGPAYKQFYDFIIVCSAVASYPNYPDSFPSLAKEPEVLSNNWDVLNIDDNCLQKLANWVQSIITSRINPLYNTNLTDASIERLQTKLNVILQAINELKLTSEQTASPLPTLNK